jgi:dTDP-4-dehydrorhamnose reductase
MVIWIIGSKGMLGRELSRYLEENHVQHVGSDREVSILEPKALRTFARKHHPDWIVNCSAYTAVDAAEDDAQTAYEINKTGVANIAAVAAELDVPLIHISTDYIFDGTSAEPLDEEAPTGPNGVYGASKLAGEEELRRLWSKHFIIRTAWLYGLYGKNFVYTMIKLMNKLDSLKVVNDQIGSPTWTVDLAMFILTIIVSNNYRYGTYHFSGAGECSWYDFAVEIHKWGKEHGLISSGCQILPCTSKEFPTKAKRPAFSLLDTTKARTVFNFEIPNWKESLRQFIRKLTFSIFK